MGRWSWSSRSTVEECKTIDIFWLNRHGYLAGYVSGVIEWNSALRGKSSVGVKVSIDKEYKWKSYMRLTYSYTNPRTDEKSDYDYMVPIVSTACNFGSVRHWFICQLEVNGRTCNRRVAKLYLPPGGRYFGCRHCYNLTYQCQKEHDKKVDLILKNPAYMDHLGEMVKAGNVKAALLVMKAFFRREEQNKKLFGL